MEVTPVFLPSLNFTPRYTNPSGLNTWTEHLPFAFDLIQSLRPAVVVELGTFYGESFFGFCQAVAECGLECSCYAVDTWRGDQHAGLYGEDVYEAVAAYRRQNYAAFSNLLRTTFDEALGRFEDETISLLHIDGLHTFEAVSHDFNSWFPKVRPGGVVLLHDTAVRHGDFGVWRFWDTLEQRLPAFTFRHGNGLGVVRKPGGTAADLASALLSADPGIQGQARRYYSIFGGQLLAAVQSKTKYTLVRLYWPDSGAYSEDRSIYAHVRMNVWEEFCLHVPTSAAAGSLRLDPTDSPGVIEVSELAIVSPSGQEPVWVLDAASMEAVQPCGTAIRIPSEEHLTILSVGQDPQLLLPELPIASAGLAVRGRMRVRTDPAVVCDSVSAAVRILEASTSPEATRELVRIAIAYPGSPDLALEELTSRARRLHEQLMLTANQLDGETQRADDCKNRLQIAASEAAHFRNLLDEQKQRADDFDNRLQIARQEAAHYRNLLEEQKQRADDFDNRLQIAKQEAAHYRNLLQGQERGAPDS